MRTPTTLCCAFKFLRVVSLKRALENFELGLTVSLAISWLHQLKYLNAQDSLVI